MTAMRLVVVGAAGRMGRMLVKSIHDAPGAALVGAVEREGSPALGQDSGLVAGIGETGILITDDPLPVFAKADGVIDFTTPAATVRFAGMAVEARIAHIVGTTGLGEEHLEALKASSHHTAILRSGNMSVGVNLLAAVARRVACTLDPDFDIEIVEMHHRDKVDAPSGTALLLGEAVAAGRATDLGVVAERGRDGVGVRKPGAIGFASLRGGTVIGEHSVVFAGQRERILLSHVAEDRAIFANGAVKAALWLHGRPPGFYSMMDVLGFAEF